MTEPTHLHLSRSDLWKRHGFLNVAMTLGAPLVGSTAAFALVVGHRFNLTAMALLVLLLAFPLANRQVLRSALAIVSNRPYLTFFEDGLRVDGGLKDSLFLKWTDVEAISPFRLPVAIAEEQGLRSARTRLRGSSNLRSSPAGCPNSSLLRKLWAPAWGACRGPLASGGPFLSAESRA